MFKSILKGQKESKIEKYIRKSLWQEIGSFQLTLDAKYLQKLLDVSKGESSQAITRKLVDVLFDNGPDSISYIHSGSGLSTKSIAEKSRETHQILCLTLWKTLVHQSERNEFLQDFGLPVDEFIKLVFTPLVTLITT